jgi:hypothetical protein
MTELQFFARAYDRISKVPGAIANDEQSEVIIGQSGLGGARKSRTLHGDL